MITEIKIYIEQEYIDSIFDYLDKLPIDKHEVYINVSFKKVKVKVLKNEEINYHCDLIMWGGCEKFFYDRNKDLIKKVLFNELEEINAKKES